MTRPTGCDQFAAILWSLRDTDETKAQVQAHNAAWKALCSK